jgi:hypothetical protein
LPERTGRETSESPKRLMDRNGLFLVEKDASGQWRRSMGVP